MIAKRTKTTMFLVPALGFTPAKLKTLGFVDAYLMDINREKTYKDALYLLFKPSERHSFELFIEENKDKILDDYDYDEGYIVVVFQFPIRFIANYDTFLQGKYSKFTSDYKELFRRPSGNTATDEDSAWLIINKHPDMRKKVEEAIGQLLPLDSEIASVPSSTVESLDFYEMYKNTQDAAE